ncbi:MAG TPA: hypothetical protein VMY42_11345 [Thermoguttaceae bacterium]|nr:hypothetical protein [Thermoguttaceae bacterium]
MCPHDSHHDSPFEPRCCPACHGPESSAAGLTRRGFLGGLGTAAFGGVALSGLSWASVSAAGADVEPAPPRRPLVVKPILVYSTPSRRPKASWRSWGGIQTQDEANAEAARISAELDRLQKKADFPVTFLPLVAIRSERELEAAGDLATADTALIYPSGGWSGVFDVVAGMGKDMIVFCRHKSGPVYLWYEIISPRYLRKHTDRLAVEGMDFGDVVVDDQDEILWRLRALCGLHNTIGTRILAVGGPGGWSQPTDVIVDLVKNRWKLDIQTVTYADLGKLIGAARQDETAVARARRRTDEYLKIPNTTLETEKIFVENAFLLEEVFRGLMKEADCRAITVNSCMGTIMPVSETTACLPLMTLNDDGYLAFCESDFVVVPSGILMGNITGRPPFLHNPTYPHDGIITLAHCTAPRKMDGKTLEPVRIVTHYESDYGAAPKVDMRVGQKLTHVNPDFDAKHWVGLSSEIVDHPFLPICRSQIDVRFSCGDDVLAEKMVGFHWMTVYDDYLREVGYALKKIPIEFEVLE